MRISDWSSDVCASELTALGGHLREGRQTGLDYDVTSLSAVNFNTGIAAAENADVILLIGTNLRWEAPLINTRLRQAVWKKGAKAFGIGPATDQTSKEIGRASCRERVCQYV